MRLGVRRLSVIAVVAALAVAAVGCGSTGDGDDEGQSDSTTTTTTVVSTTTAPKVLERPIDKTVWWEGFEISVDDLKAEPQAGSGVNVTIGVTWTNLSDASAFPPQPTLAFGGEVITPSSDAGEAAGQASVDAALTAYIPEETDPVSVSDDLELVWGEAGDNQSIVPLDEDTEPTTFEPQELAAFAGTVTTPTVVIDVSDGRYGWSYKTGDEGKFVLTALIKVSCGSPCPDEGTAMSLADLTLTVPGESTPQSPDDELSQFCCVAVYPGTVDDEPTNTIAFVVDGEPSGSYTLTYNPDRSDPVPGTLEFDV